MKDSRLYRLFQPTHYTLDLILQRQKRRFAGTVTIEGETSEHADGVYLHAHKLHVVAATIDDQRAVYEHGEQDTLKLTVDSFRPGKHVVRVEFQGAITDTMHGLYPCHFTLDGEQEELLVTQFESHHARSVFPCIDEPEAKATFDLTLTTETNITVVSNTPIAEQHERNDQLTTTFETTPTMSTYLLAWVAGKLDYQEATTKDGVTIRAYATPDKKDKLAYATNEAVRCLEYLNEYFAVPYPLAKCDFIAVPDFSAGAMENWGCITFRETTLLVDEHSSTHTKQYVTMVIAHELAHQWFGDLVTMRWWNDLWLNESFANLMEHVVAGQLHPDWDMMTQHYEVQTAHAIERDSLSSVQKIQQEIHSPDEIETLFDPAIVYAKGGSLLHMLHTYLGAEVFRDGLRSYLERHSYGNTNASDLWDALSEASGQNVGAFMEPWITQSGLPVVTVGVGDQTVNLRQHRFFSTPQSQLPSQTTWPIPLLSGGQLDNDVLSMPSASLRLARSNSPLLLNQGRTGYFLAQYNTAHTKQLAEEVRRGNLNPIDRLGLLSDSLNLSRAGLQPHRISLQLLEAYVKESSQPVWGAISAHIRTLRMFAETDEGQIRLLRAFIRTLAVPQYERLGWQQSEDEPYFDTLLRPVVIGHMAYAEDEKVVTKLQAMFEAAASPAELDADIRAVVLAVAAKFGGDTVFSRLLDWHANIDSAEQRIQIVAGICAAREPQLVERALGLLTTDDVRRQDLFYWIIHLSRNRHARELAWQWVQDNWRWITDHYAQDLHYTSFPKYFAAAFSHPEQLTSYRSFFEPMIDSPSLGRTIAQGIEDIEGRVQWRQRDGQDVADYLTSRS